MAAGPGAVPTPPHGAAGFSPTPGQAGSLQSLVGPHCCLQVPAGAGHASRQLGSGLDAWGPGGRAMWPLLPVHSLPLKTNSFCLRGGKAGLVTSWPLFPLPY